jgi:hypothetical protein
MIKKLEVEDIVKILKLDDETLTKVFPCEVGEWVQFLIQHVDNPNSFMMGEMDGDKLTGYYIAINAIAPPINFSVSVLYSKTAGKETNKIFLDALIDWAKEKGADSIDFITNNVVGCAVYGFKKKAALMSMKI